MSSTPKHAARRPSTLLGLTLLILLGLMAAACASTGGEGGSVTPSVLTITTTSVPDALTSQAYNQTLQTTGGSGAKAWTISTGALPAGLMLDAAAGTIAGTATATGNFDFTVQVQDSSSPQQTDTQALTIRVADPLTITTAVLPNGSDGVAYNQNVTSTGGLGPLTWSISAGTRPPGIDLGASTTNTVVLSGTNTTGGTFNFTVRVQDSLAPNPQVVTQPYTVRILKVTTTSLPNAIQSSAYNTSVQATGASASGVIWSEPTTRFDDITGIGALGTPCEGLTLTFDSGAISGTPTTTGACTFTIQARDRGDARTDDQALAITVVQQLQITTAMLSNATTGAAYNQALAASGGVPSYTWTEPSALLDTPGSPCEGLQLDPAGAITGTPINVGDCGPITLQVQDAGTPQQMAQKDFTLTVDPGPLTITTVSLPGGAVNRSYLGEIDASGGTPPFLWSESTASFNDINGQGTAATPCQGLTLDFNTGDISGVPVNQGTCGPFTINVRDSALVPDTDSKQFSIVVGPEPAAGRNDTVQAATDFSAGSGNQTNGNITILGSISPYDVPAATHPNAADNDFYKFSRAAGNDVIVEIFAQRLATPSPLDSVIEIVDLNGNRILSACKDEGTVNGTTGQPDPTPNAFDDNCVNDDITLGITLDSKLTFRVPAGNTTFAVRVLSFAGNARPDLLYELHVTNAD